MSRKPYFLAAALLIAVVGTIGGVKALQIRGLITAAKTMRPPAQAVSTSTAEKASWERVIESVGSLRATQGAALSTELSGVVTKILFENGAEVRAGDPLVELDTEMEEANLRSAEAEADLARTVYERTKRLRSSNAVPQSDLDAAESQLRKMTALVEQLRSTIRKKQVRAPFSGRLGIREVNLGQFVDNGDKIVSLQALDPIFVDFLLPQQLLARLKPGQKARVGTDVYPGETFEGELTAINPDVDQVTRNIRVQGTLQNRNGQLRPGMFVKVSLVLGEAEEVIRIPLTALMRAPYGDSVFVIEEQKSETGETVTVAKQRFVRTGRNQGDFVAIIKGLNVGETVVSAGAFKLRNGVPVLINNETAPKPQTQPEPPNS